MRKKVELAQVEMQNWKCHAQILVKMPIILMKMKRNGIALFLQHKELKVGCGENYGSNFAKQNIGRIKSKKYLNLIDKGGL